MGRTAFVLPVLPESEPEPEDGEELDDEGTPETICRIESTLKECTSPNDSDVTMSPQYQSSNEKKEVRRRTDKKDRKESEE